MDIPFYYKVKANYVIRDENNNLQFKEYEKPFFEEPPITARENAFDHFESVLHAFELRAKVEGGKVEDFFDAKSFSDIVVGEKKLSVSDSLDRVLGVFLVDKSFNSESLIHGIGYSPRFNDHEYFFSCLQEENELYDKYKFDKKNYAITINLLLGEGNDEDSGATIQGTILNTPINWSSYNVPYKTPKEDVLLEKEIIWRLDEEELKSLIYTGECNQVEFKSSIVHDIITEKGTLSIKEIIAKTISAFLNTNGGYLIIGVKDNKRVAGLESDYARSGNRNDHDFFQQEFDKIIRTHLDFSVKSNIKTQFAVIDNKEIFVATIFGSKNHPVFFRKKLPNEREVQEFYVRGEASSNQLNIEKAIKYCIDKWYTK